MTKFNDMLELNQERHETLGEVFVLTAKATEDGCPFQVETEMVEVETGVEGPNGEKEMMSEPQDSSVSLRISEKTALKLAMDILRRLGRV